MIKYRVGRILTCAALLMSACPLFAEWTALGPFGGSAAVVATDPHSKTVLAGTPNALLFRSVDAGESWTPLRFPAQLQAVLHTLVIHPLAPNVYLAGLSSDLPQYSGMLRSADSGTTWQQVPSLRGLQVRALAFFRGNPQIFAAGTDRGVFLSRDGGVAWSRISPEDNQELQPVVSVTFDPNNSAILYAGTPHLPWKTEDAGVTWHSIYSGMIDDSDIFSIVVDRNRSQRVFAGACSGIYQSLSAGSTWTRGSQDAAKRTYVMVQDPQYEDVLFAGSASGLIRSADGGLTWRKLLSYPTRSIAFDLGHLGRIYIATDEQGILRSEDGGKTWRLANYGFCNRRLTSLAITRDAFQAGTAGDLPAASVPEQPQRGTDLPMGANSLLSALQPASAQAAFAPGRHLFLATPNAVLVSADAGGQWTRVPAPDPESPVTGFAVPPWAPNQLVASTASSLFISKDTGISWQGAEPPVTNTGIRALWSSASPWIVSTSASKIFLSADGKVWKTGALPRGTEVYDVVASGPSSLLAATSSGLRVSSDLGFSWKPVPGKLEGNTVQALTRHPSRTSTLFAAQFGVLHSSHDGGHSWTRISPDDWPVTSVKQLLVAPGAPDRLFVLTAQQGVFVLELDTASDETTANY